MRKTSKYSILFYSYDSYSNYSVASELRTIVTFSISALRLFCTMDFLHSVTKPIKVLVNWTRDYDY